MGNDDLWTQTDVGEKYNLEGMRMNHTAGNRRIFHRYSCLALCRFILLTLSRTEDSITIEFKISDTGIGMTEDFVKNKLFTPFVQAENSSRTSYMGTGLGMSIVKSIVEKMNGSITVESKLGEGSCFTVVLPFKLDRCGSPVHEKLAATADIAGLRLLLVEDNDLNAEMAQFMLTDSGAEVVTVQDGLAAVQEIEKVKRTICEQIALCSRYNRIKED